MGFRVESSWAMLPLWRKAGYRRGVSSTFAWEVLSDVSYSECSGITRLHRWMFLIYLLVWSRLVRFRPCWYWCVTLSTAPLCGGGWQCRGSWTQSIPLHLGPCCCSCCYLCIRISCLLWQLEEAVIEVCTQRLSPQMRYFVGNFLDAKVIQCGSACITDASSPSTINIILA